LIAAIVKNAPFLEHEKWGVCLYAQMDNRVLKLALSP